MNTNQTPPLSPLGSPSCSLFLGCCLDVMKHIPDGSVDMVCADLPYGTTSCKWDSVIPFEPLWEEYKRVCKPNAAIVLTASQPFTSALVMSNIRAFKHEWVWNKKIAGNPMLAKRQPLKIHENVLVFSFGTTIYNPIMWEATVAKRRGYGGKSKLWSGLEKIGEPTKERYPVSIAEFSNGNRARSEIANHPTQKPVALMEYLIRTYSNGGHTVLDNTMGSGTTGVACVNTGRGFIGIERDEEYFRVASERISSANINANLDQIPLTDISALATTAQLATAKSEIIGEIGQLPNLAEIEGSATLAKEATVASRASQASVSAIPTAPLLANDPRLGNLDTTISSRLATSAYVPPSNPDLTGIATTAQLNAARDSINTNIDSIPTVTPPTASENAAAVRTNLTAELARISNAEQVLLTQPYVPTPAPSVIVPNPGVSPDTTKVYAYTESITNRAVAGIEITFELVTRPAKTERILETGKVSIVTNSQGYAEIELQRGKTYRVTSPRLSLDENFTPTTALFDLSTLIPS